MIPRNILRLLTPACLATLLVTSPVASATEPAAARETFATLAANGDSQALPGAEGWLFLRAELRHLGVGEFWGSRAAEVSRASSPDKADPLPAIVDFNRQLKSAGIELILLPVPPKAIIYPGKLDPALSGRLDADLQRFYAELGKEGVKVLDLTGQFLDETKKPDAPLLYCRTDTHWTPFACELAAAAIKKEIGSPAWLKPEQGVFSSKNEPRNIIGDLTQGKGNEEIPARVVTGADGRATINPASPVLLIGDSHTLVFNVGNDLHGTGAGLADQLALELGIPVDVMGVRGSGATPARINLLRRIKSNPGLTAEKKVIVWCFAAREFTESTGWSQLKVIP